MNSIHHSDSIDNYFKSLKLGLFLSDVYLNHLMSIVDDTIASHTKPSLQALHPIKAAYFHQSHLKRCQEYGKENLD